MEMRLRKLHFIHRYPFLILSFFICLSAFLLCLRSLNSEKPFQVLYDDSITEFVVNTPGCRIPSWDPWDPTVRSLYKPVNGPYKCLGTPSFLRVGANGIISLDNTFLNLYYEVGSENVTCTYEPIFRDESILDEKIDQRFILGKSRPLPFDVPLEHEFVKTTCLFSGVEKGRKSSFVEYIPLTPLKKTVESKCKRSKETKKPPMKKRLNVIFLGIDSISRLNYVRHFPKTRKYLTEQLHPVELLGYTKVGDNTFPNLVPMLTGHFYQYYYNETGNKTMFFDDLDFMWKEFANYGYRTLLAEDAPVIATFNYLRNGFRRPPTDYYYRPFALSVEDSKVRHGQCFGSKMEMQVIYDYLRSFVQTMGSSRQFFAFVFLARLTHDVLNYAGYADEPTYHLLRQLDQSGVLKNSVLVFFSDHGIRFGDIRKTYVGQFEERMPFVDLVFPRWFLKRYKKLTRNLKLNQNRLTTPFDIHATILDLIRLDTDPKDEAVLTTPGISLFREVSIHRTCAHASISPHWCTCQMQKSVPVTDETVVQAAQTVINTINEWTISLRNKCTLLTLGEVMDARVSNVRSSPPPRGANDSSQQTSNFLSASDPDISEYFVVLRADPSEALFEATVRCFRKRRTCFVADDVSRINKYGDQSSCIDNAVLRKYCYCS